MSVEIADSVEWAEVRKQIDSDFGEGMTRIIRSDSVPVVKRKDNTSSFYLIPPDWTNKLEGPLEGFEVWSLGHWLGNMVDGIFKISLAAIEEISWMTKSILTVSRIGAEAFTYGRSILGESLVDIGPNLKRGQKVVVVNENRECLGLAVLTMSSERAKHLGADRLVAKNIADIGWYIRRYS